MILSSATHSDAPAADAQTPAATETTAEVADEPTPPAEQAQQAAPTEAEPTSPAAAVGWRQRVRRTVGWALSALAVAGLLAAMTLPYQRDLVVPAAFVRIPLEAVVAAALLLVLPGRLRTPVAAGLGALLGVLTVLKVADMGFFSVLARPFDPVMDWGLLADGYRFLDASYGRAAAVGAAVGAVLLTGAVLALAVLATVRTARLLARHRRVGGGVVGTMAAGWLVFALLGTTVTVYEQEQVTFALPVADRATARLAYDHTLQVGASLRDRQEFAELAAVDAFRDVPGDELLTALRGKDVLLAFVESYGRDAVTAPEFAPYVADVLDDGSQRLAAQGFGSRSAFLTSSTVGGSSWLAHGSTLSGLWVDNQQRYHSLVTSDRLTLTRAFGSAGWRVSGFFPGNSRAWPEGAFFGYDQVYDSRNMGYAGDRFAFASIPDQYVLSAFDRLERQATDGPVMAEVALLSSHAPWTPVPQLVDWDTVRDGAVFDRQEMAADQENRSVEESLRDDYPRAVGYSLSTIISYIEARGDDDLVVVFLGDHQPSPVVTGPSASHDVPVTIVSRDPAVLDAVADWDWQDGLRPDGQAPVWQMDQFRDRFLTAFR
ncbi:MULTISPECIES: sulfatase-like hydrolase/transferase [unclassified Solwaraspora]|uniref:sulfatase-like hydrolase/transferase n=1 Tax=unclassified Solwaraspora TaxID=2627926 RepID=UPI00259AEE6C|nr:sulfatase-like hydrolase/transferase [Solwaraspora sp. WMMA2056]WJK43009.1 sulfatase [Solwaraspora sp. WMMA2056]